MKFSSQSLVLLILIASISALAHEANEESGVVKLTVDNFQSTTNIGLFIPEQEKLWFIMFYAPWCTHC